MTTKVLDDDATRAELLVTEMRVHAVIDEVKTTDRGYDSTRDEYHETTQTVNTERKTVTCPVIRIYNEETGEEVPVDAFESLVDENGLGQVERADYDMARYTVDGIEYLAEYDMSSVESLR